VQNTTPPTLTTNGIGGCYTSLQAAITAATGATSGTANCGGPVTITASGNGDYCPAIITVTGTDDCGLSSMVTYTVKILTNGPTLSGVPASTNYQCITDVPAEAPVTASDSCGLALTPTVTDETNVNQAAPCSWTITRTWSVTDCAGQPASESQTITVQDTTLPGVTQVPIATCYTSVTTASNAALNATTFTSTLCGGGITTNVTVSGTCSATITVTGTDACGNSASVTYTTEILTKPPTLIGVPANGSFSCLPQVPAEAVVTATNACGGTLTPTVTDVTNSNGTCGYTITRTWSVTDCASQTTSGMQTITVQDTALPGVAQNTIGSCYTNLTSAESAAVTATTFTPTACGGAVTPSVSASGAPCKTTITVTGTDACGKSSVSVMYSVSILTAPPTFSGCPVNTNVQCASEIPAPATVTATDSCGNEITPPNLTFTQTESNPTSTCSNVITRIWSATDCAGQMATCTQVITQYNNVAATLTCPPNVTVTNTNGVSSEQFCSVTQGGWGAPPNGGNPGALLAAHFSTVYPSGVKVGITSGPGFYMKFTSAAAIEAYLPAGGTPAALTATVVNPTSTHAGVFGGQVLALQLNVDFANAGFNGNPIGSLVYTDPSSPLNGKTLSQILAIENIALGGGNVSSYGVTLNDLETLADNINQGFDGCVTDGWAASHLVPATTGFTPPPPSETGTPTVTASCGGTVKLTYSDAITTEPCGELITRTWTVVDSCGNSNRCVQLINVVNVVSACPCPPEDIKYNFNGTQIIFQSTPGGSYVWFTSDGTVSGLPSAGATLHITDQSITIPATGSSPQYVVPVPDAYVTFSPSVTVATTTFNTSSNAWIIDLPTSALAGNVFFGGVAFKVPVAGLPAGIQNVDWSGEFTTATPGLSVNWQWHAAAYSDFTSDYNSIAPKPVDDNNASIYKNSDHAGTPEGTDSVSGKPWKNFVEGGGSGGGGGNYCGSGSSTIQFSPCVCSGCGGTPGGGSSSPTCVTNQICGNFNSQNPGGGYCWFNSHISCNPGKPCTVNCQNASVTLTCSDGKSYTFPVPDCQVNFSPSCSSASCQFNGTKWTTTVPCSGDDQIFLSGCGIPWQSDFANCRSVCWNGSFSCDTPGVNCNWQWSCACYNCNLSNCGSINVKPCQNVPCGYPGGDQCGTPENCKNFCQPGGCGGGGGNYTGSWSGTGSFSCR
jgi:hypothetical protein